jgi:thiamine pyrophosphate-dependent acetolactate synthase large subunit-like protein
MSDDGAPPNDDTTERAELYDCIARLLDTTPDAAVVSNLGVASYALAAVEDRPRNFYLWGSMGVTTPVGFGLALSTDEQVTVLDGDGSMLMSLGVLSTVAAYDPGNLTIVVLQNDVYETTGGQRTHAAHTDFGAVATDCGLQAWWASSADEFEAAYREAVDSDGAGLVAVDVETADPDARPPFDFAYVKRRVRDEFA